MEASFPTSTTTFTTTSNPSTYQWERDEGSSQSLRRILIDLSRKGRAFWWLPEASDIIHTLRATDGALIAMIRPIGPFWEWIRINQEFDSLNFGISELLPDRARLLTVQSSIPRAFGVSNTGSLGMFEPRGEELSLAQEHQGQAMCLFLFTEEDRTPHSGYPPPLQASEISESENL